MPPWDRKLRPGAREPPVYYLSSISADLDLPPRRPLPCLGYENAQNFLPTCYVSQNLLPSFLLLLQPISSHEKSREREPETTRVSVSVSEKPAASVSSLCSFPAASPHHLQYFGPHLLFPLTLLSKPVMSIRRIPLKVSKVPTTSPSSPSWTRGRHCSGCGAHCLHPIWDAAAWAP